MSEWVGHGYTVEIQQDMIDVTSGLPTLDPEWTGTDAEGHEHRGGRMTATARMVREQCGCPLVNEPHDVFVRWECVICGAEVSPGVLPPMHPRSVPGLRYMTVRYVDGTTWSISDRSAVQRRILDGPPLSHDFLDEVGVRVVDGHAGA